MSHGIGETKQPRSHRLGVIHFLLWMLGCAAAVTGYRVFTNWSQVAAEDVAFVRLMHVELAIAARFFWLP
jgi:hypothetical protein